MKKIALTGGIASGKSRVREMLAELGVPVMDADDVTHHLYEHDDELRDQIRETFGEQVFDARGQIDRVTLGRQAFCDPEKLRQLARWIHPKVHPHLEAFFKQHADQPAAVAVIPVLFEYGLEKDYDTVWVVHATREQQIERLRARSGSAGKPLTAAEGEDRLNRQMPLDEKAQRPGVTVIDNTGSLERTREQVVRLVRQLQKEGISG